MGLISIKNLKNILISKLGKDKYPKAPSLDEVEKMTIEEVNNARSNFNDADDDTIDLAIYELMAAEERLSLLIKERKKKP